jgi:hypothetical protein
VLVIYFCVGLLKWNYIINPGIVKGNFFLYRYQPFVQKNYNTKISDTFSYFLKSPKWLSAIIYGNVFLLLNLIVIYLVYQKKEYTRFTFWLFFWVSVTSIALLLLSLMMGVYTQVYTVVAQIKELQQSPFTLALLLVGFKLHSDQRK